MTIYQNTFDGWTTYHTSFKAAANDIASTEAAMEAYISTTRLDEAEAKVITLDETDAAYQYALDINREDEQETLYEAEHIESLRHPSSIFNLAVDLMKGRAS